MTSRSPVLPSPRRAARSLLPALVALLAALSPLRAQESPATPSRVDFTGRVTDARTGAPVARALVTIKGGHGTAATDAEGRFVIARLRPRAYLFTVERLGYEGAAGSVRLDAASVPAEVRLVSQPLMLERISVNADRLQSRRNSVPVSVRTLQSGELASSPYRSVAQLVMGRLVSPVRCRGGQGMCIFSRGEVHGVSVYVDEIPAFGGLDQLEMYGPHEIFLIESYAQGRMIRVYTNEYMDRLARTNRSPDPVIW